MKDVGAVYLIFVSMFRCEYVYLSKDYKSVAFSTMKLELHMDSSGKISLKYSFTVNAMHLMVSSALNENTH